MTSRSAGRTIGGRTTEQVLRTNEKAIAEFRSNHGRLKAFGDAPVLLLTTTGARSGEPRTSPMMYLQDSSRPDTVYVFASAAGADHDPAWFKNIVAHPRGIGVEIGEVSTTADAVVLAEPERSAVFAIQAALYQGFADYQTRTDRVFPVVALTLHPTGDQHEQAAQPLRNRSHPMKTVQFHEYGDTTVLRHEETDRPTAGPGEVVLRVAATTFNQVDAAIRAGYLQQPFPLELPHTPGLDVSGTVDEIGEGVTDLSVGDEVLGFLPMDRNGAAAEFVVAPAAVLTSAPRSIALSQAAALPTTGLSAWQSLFEHADLQPGQRLLINGAGGAVGGYAVQLAKQAGAVVIATASPRSADAVRRQGADQVIDHTAEQVETAVTEPVDAILNLVPLSDPAPLVSLVRPGGVFVTTVPGQPEPQSTDVRTAVLFVRSDREQLAALVERVDAGTLTVDVAETVPLSELASVHARSDAGQLRGKVVLTP